MTIKLYDSITAARRALDIENPEFRFADAIKKLNVNFESMTTADAQAVMNFVEPQFLQIGRARYMVKYPDTNYRDFMPVDTAGGIFSPGSIYYSGDIVGAAQWYESGADDMPYASITDTQHIQENVNAAIGIEWTAKDLERARMFGRDLLTEKSDSAIRVAERFIHKVATVGDGAKFTTGFFNNPLATTSPAAATFAASTPDVVCTMINDTVSTVETNTRETMIADTVVMPTAVYNTLSNRRVTDTGMNVIQYVLANSSVPNLMIKKSRHLTTSMIAYANTLEAHRFHLPGGGHQFGLVREKGAWAWERPGIMNIGGYECSIPKAFTFLTGIAS